MSNAPMTPPSGGPSETSSADDYKKLLEEMNREKVAAYSIHIITPGTDEGTFDFEYFLIKNLNIGEGQSVNFRALVHNKRTAPKKTGEGISQITDYPPMNEGENLMEYIQRVEQLPYMEWNDIYFDESMTLRYRGRTVYQYDEHENKYHYLRGDKLSIREEGTEPEKSSVVPFKPNKDD